MSQSQFPKSGQEPGRGICDVSLHIEQGEAFSLLGPSGCGKTTTLRCIGGLDAPDSGHILFDGRDITHLPAHRRDIRTVFQKYALFPHLSVLENVCFGPRMQGVRREEQIRRSLEALALLRISQLRDRSTSQLSGGEAQRVALARALVTNPSVLLLDEPLSALDLKLREAMQRELVRLRKELGMTFVFVTHDQDEAMFLSDRIGIMFEGRIMQVGKPEEIYRKPSCRFVAEFLGDANFLGANTLMLATGATNRLPQLPNNGALMVRPESLTLEADDSQEEIDKQKSINAGMVRFSASVERQIFLGDARVVTVKLTDGTGLTVKRPSHVEPLSENQRCFVSFRVEDVWPVGIN